MNTELQKRAREFGWEISLIHDDFLDNIGHTVIPHINSDGVYTGTDKFEKEHYTVEEVRALWLQTFTHWSYTEGFQHFEDDWDGPEECYFAAQAWVNETWPLERIERLWGIFQDADEAGSKLLSGKDIWQAMYDYAEEYAVYSCRRCWKGN